MHNASVLIPLYFNYTVLNDLFVLCVRALPSGMYVYHMYVWCLPRPEGVGTLRRVTSIANHHAVLRNKPKPSARAAKAPVSSPLPSPAGCVGWYFCYGESILPA